MASAAASSLRRLLAAAVWRSHLRCSNETQSSSQFQQHPSICFQRGFCAASEPDPAEGVCSGREAGPLRALQVVVASRLQALDPFVVQDDARLLQLQGLLRAGALQEGSTIPVR